MGDLISRDAAFDEIIWNSDNGVIDAKVAIEALRKLPSVEPERKKGKWIEGKKTPGYTKWNCSECGLLVRNTQKPWYEYCPKCGAPMEVSNDT